MYNFINDTRDCIKEANLLKTTIQTGLKYKNNCTKPPFYSINKPIPDNNPYGGCLLMLEITDKIIKKENELALTTNHPDAPSVADMLLYLFFEPALEANMNVATTIDSLSGINLEFDEAYKVMMKTQQQRSEIMGGKKSKSVRRRKRATRIRRRHHRRKSSITITRHDLRRGSNKRTVRRLQ